MTWTTTEENGTSKLPTACLFPSSKLMQKDCCEMKRHSVWVILILGIYWRELWMAI